MHRFWVLIGTLFTLTCPGKLLIRVPIQQLHDARPLASGGEVRDLVAAERVVMLAGPLEDHEQRTLLRLDGERMVPLAVLPPKQARTCAGQRLVRGEKGRWWFGRCDGDEVQFVRSDAPSRVLTASGAGGAIAWTALEGDEPAGVLLSEGQIEGLIRAELVTPSGADVLGDFRRYGSLGYGPPTWQAHRLADGSIAIVSLEDDGAAVLLRTFRDGGMNEARLAFERQRYLAVASASGEHGIAVVVSRPSGGGLFAMVVDPADPESAKPLEIDGSDAPLLARYGSQVVPLGKRFAVTWTNANDRGVRLSEFDREVALPAVHAGGEADIRLLLPILQPAEEGVSLFWSQGAVMQRTLPTEAVGYLLAAELWEVLSVVSCQWSVPPCQTAQTTDN